jgi:hypothetical protein
MITSQTTRLRRLLAALALAGALVLGAHASQASAPTACHGLSPASATGCSDGVYAP